MTESQKASPLREPRLLGLTAPTRAALIPPLTLARWVILLILAACIYFFNSFLVPVLAALIIGFASWPIYRRVREACGGNRTLAASIMIGAITIFIVVPAMFILSFGVAEARALVQWAIETNATGAAPPEWFATIPLAGDWLTQIWIDRIGTPGALAALAQGLAGANIFNIYHGILAVSGSTLNFLLNMLFMIVALLFIYRDGASFVANLDRIGERIFPSRWSRISRIVPATISSTVTGMTIIAIGEGIVLGIAYWLAGAPAPVLLGIITGVAAMIPGGAPLSFTLVSIYLAASGSVVEGIALLTWGSVELFIVDKTLRPKLVGGPIKLPFLPTFFGLIGGVKTMGFVGLFLGPVLMALLVSLWREWVRDLDDPAVEVRETIMVAQVEALPEPQPRPAE
ncbi:Predicted PurR-regulated permease PerM [Devosia enhydra]|uniref:Predicted PurR-regulated permease PerM n=1 Tax=Devosia enhydra TaxID=665118 RepID=A0A1K2I3V6_9HYPH|nr:AI-2E family transporter [Devosia enhydra]SFZ86428.1 Predicted PurR-regulated permease PerM [Devosia enhydra]